MAMVRFSEGSAVVLFFLDGGKTQETRAKFEEIHDGGFLEVNESINWQGWCFFSGYFL